MTGMFHILFIFYMLQKLKQVKILGLSLPVTERSCAGLRRSKSANSEVSAIFMTAPSILQTLRDDASKKEKKAQ
ncbi:MAG: hypothetical protein CSB55_08140 [Candidatus Cloacimonadota bacterium]|nr:MAG: hypothetical protein CSB55_08140 [Candidatus Cloacimonadota bacterium]